MCLSRRTLENVTLTTTHRPLKLTKKQKFFINKAKMNSTTIKDKFKENLQKSTQKQKSNLKKNNQVTERGMKNSEEKKDGGKIGKSAQSFSKFLRSDTIRAN